MKNTQNNDISNLPYHQVSSTQSDSEIVVERIERSVLEQSGLANEGVPSFSFDEVFALVEAHAHIPFEGPRGVLALREQFQGTSLERVFQSFSAGEAITAAALQNRINNMFTDSGWDEAEIVHVDHRRVYRDVGGELYTDRKYHVDWQQRAHHYRLAAEQIVHGFPVTDIDEIEVLFTPRMTTPNEFKLSSYRIDIFEHMKQPDSDKGYDTLTQGAMKMIFPPEGNGYLYIGQHQLRVVVSNGHGGWIERGSLAFINIDWVEMSLRSFTAPKRGVYDRSECGLLDITYPTAYFDKNIWFTGEEPDEFGHYIMTALPTDLQPPDPASLIYKDEGYPELTDMPPSGQ